MQQITTNGNNNSGQLPGSREIASIRVAQSCGCGYPKLYVRYKGETQYVPLKISTAQSAPALNNRYVDVFSNQAVNGIKSFGDYIRVSSSNIKGGATQVFGDTAGGGLNNVLIGTNAGNAMAGGNNIMIGDSACLKATDINNTVAIGVQSGPQTDYQGDNNFFLGYKAGYNMTRGSGNVHIGQGSGISGTYNDRLFIGNPGEPTNLESAHIITGYFNTGVLRFPKGYANSDTNKFLTTGSDGTLVLSAPKMPTDYISNNPVNTLARDNTSNHGITDANLIRQSLTYWNNSTKSNTPSGFDQGIGITGISPDGSQAGQVVLDKTANMLSFRSKATNVWKAWKTVETTDNKVTNLGSPDNVTYPTTQAIANWAAAGSYRPMVRTKSTQTLYLNQFAKIATIHLNPNATYNNADIHWRARNVYFPPNSNPDVANVFFHYQSQAGGVAYGLTRHIAFDGVPFFSFYLNLVDDFTIDIYVSCRSSYTTIEFTELTPPNFQSGGSSCFIEYFNTPDYISQLPTTALPFQNQNDATQEWVQSQSYLTSETDPVYTADKVHLYRTDEVLNGSLFNHTGDLNNIGNNGVVHIQQGSSTNSPFSTSPGGIVYSTFLNSGSGYKTQFGLEYGANTRAWVRNQYLISQNPTWSNWKELLGTGDRISLFNNDSGFITNAAIGNGTIKIATSGIATGALSFTTNQSDDSSLTINVPATNITASLNSTTHILSINSSTGTDAKVDLTPLVDGQLLLSGEGWQLKGQGTGKQAVGINALDFVIYDSAYSGNIGVTGEASVAFGEGNFVSGDRSASFGSENTSTGSRSFSLGLSSDAVGDGAFAHGQGTTVNGAWAAGFGISLVNGNYAFAAGNGNYAPSYSEVSVGIWGTNYTPASATAVNANDRIFNVGNGTSSAIRKDALTVYKSGIVKISSLAGSGGRMVTADANGNLRPQAITAGTVTSVGMTVGGAALNVTPATIVSSGTFALTWAGTNAQYVNGQGNLVTFPAIPAGTVKSITIGNGLTGTSPITSTGTITLGTPNSITLSSANSVTAGSHTHAFVPGGTTSQYIRGDGSLATMPSIPTIGNGILTIQQNGSTVGTFRANQSGNTTINLAGGSGSNEIDDNGYKYGSSTEFDLGWDTRGGFAANATIVSDPTYDVAENDYTVYCIAPCMVTLPDPNEYPNRMLRIVGGLGDNTMVRFNDILPINYLNGTINQIISTSILIQAIVKGDLTGWYLVGGSL